MIHDLLLVVVVAVVVIEVVVVGWWLLDVYSMCCYGISPHVILIQITVGHLA